MDIIGSVRRSLVFRSTTGDDDLTGRFGGLFDKIGSSIRKSRIGLFAKPPVSTLPSSLSNDSPSIRWMKGELIGCGAFGRVYMGMNLDTGELLAVKQVSIAPNSVSKEKTQAHIRELEEEVNLLKNLSHQNIVRYLGTTREEDSLNILLEFVPGGSISSLLGKFGSFPESVVRMYTKQLLLGLEYLHKNDIMHRDIKGANILVDNKGCIKLADFGASKKVVELATVIGAKSMKGTPYWMAPEVILQTGHSFSADIWSVGCTVIEMATGKPPWSQQYQEVAALFHIGTTKSHPPIPEHLSTEAKDFLLKCLQKEPCFRLTASELLQHPFMKDVCDMGSVRCYTVYPEKLSGAGLDWRAGNSDDDMCQIDDDFCIGESANLKSVLESTELNKSFNPMSEPTDDWSSKFDKSPGGLDLPSYQKDACSSGGSFKDDNDFTFPISSGPSAAEEEEEVTEAKIRAFLDEMALVLKKLQTPLYEEFYYTVNSVVPQGAVSITNCDSSVNLPPKSKSPKGLSSRRLSVIDIAGTASPGSHSKPVLDVSSVHDRALQEIQPPVNDGKGLLLDDNQGTISSSMSFSERQRKWKAELDEELERKREMLRQAGKSSSPKDQLLARQRERLRFAFPGNMSFSERQRKWKAELDEELERKRVMLRQARKSSSPKDQFLARQRERLRFAFPEEKTLRQARKSSSPKDQFLARQRAVEICIPRKIRKVDLPPVFEFVRNEEEQCYTK